MYLSNSPRGEQPAPQSTVMFLQPNVCGHSHSHWPTETMWPHISSGQALLLNEFVPNSEVTYSFQNLLISGLGSECGERMLYRTDQVATPPGSIALNSAAVPSEPQASHVTLSTIPRCRHLPAGLPARWVAALPLLAPNSVLWEGL